MIPTGSRPRTPRKKIAFAEDGAIFEGYAAAGIDGIREGTSNPVVTLPADVRQLSRGDRACAERVAPRRRQWPLFGGAGRRRLHRASPRPATTAIPVSQHIHRLVETEIIWAPAIAGGFVLTTRGGDFDLHIGQDFSIGYLSHTDTAVRLYLQETFTFLLLTSEAAVALSHRRRRKSARRGVLHDPIGEPSPPALLGSEMECRRAGQRPRKCL